MKSTNLTKGIILIVLAALCTSFGQLFWKMGVGGNILLILLGFVLYGVGALSMIVAFKFGNLSILHPLMCVGYIFALINGTLFLNEQITTNHTIGIVIIIIGVIFIARGEKNE
ncbi:EamA family transporter [uncultured Clostridium sp.]|uniref:EamA family transporter n=1 Tax=uncultured Clostridium sp. TaxID=59620 RepID=UPI00262BCB91|nr:EamA family transporter [uncultured Clostridium sp.]